MTPTILFGALTITIGAGVIDHHGWEASYGQDLGKVAVTQEIVTTRRSTLQITAEHWSSLDTDSDRGANSLLIEYKFRLR